MPTIIPYQLDPYLYESILDTPVLPEFQFSNNSSLISETIPECIHECNNQTNNNQTNNDFDDDLKDLPVLPFKYIPNKKHFMITGMFDDYYRDEKVRMNDTSIICISDLDYQLFQYIRDSGASINIPMDYLDYDTCDETFYDQDNYPLDSYTMKAKDVEDHFFIDFILQDSNNFRYYKIESIKTWKLYDSIGTIKNIDWLFDFKHDDLRTSKHLTKIIRLAEIHSEHQND